MPSTGLDVCQPTKVPLQEHIVMLAVLVARFAKKRVQTVQSKLTEMLLLSIMNFVMGAAFVKANAREKSFGLHVHKAKKA